MMALRSIVGLGAGAAFLLSSATASADDSSVLVPAPVPTVGVRASVSVSAPRPHAELADLRDLNVAFRTTGQVITIIGLATVVLGITAGIAYGETVGGQYSGSIGAGIGSAGALHGLLTIAVGAPMWGVGAARVRDLEPVASANLEPPSLFGPRTLTLKLAF
jgi:hypothetical protein